jgi:hypothetical protein
MDTATKEIGGIIKTKYWELPIAALRGWRPYTCYIDYRLLMGPEMHHHERGLSLYKNLMIGINGARGACKSTTGAFLGIKRMRMGIPCYSNVPISVYVIEADGSLTYYESRPLDIERFSNLEEDMFNITVVIQEMQYIVEARTSGRLQNRKVGYGIMQIRKTASSFIYDVQDQSWVDKRFGWSNDCDIECSDASKLNYDIEGELPPEMFEDGHYLKEGAVSLWSLKDVSGVLTGIPYKKSGIVYDNFQFDAFWFWNSFPTHFIVDADAAYNSIKSKDDIKKKDQEVLQSTLEEAINQLLNQGKTEVMAKELWLTAANVKGQPIDTRIAGKILKDCGIPKRQRTGGEYSYNIAALLEDKITEAPSA